MTPDLVERHDLAPRSGASGCWYEISDGRCAGRPALFLDRDGVIIEDTHFLSRPEDLRMLVGAADAIARANRLGIPVVLVSNQSGIARGFYDWSAFAAVQEALAAALGQNGARLDAVFACAHHADGRAPFNIPDHPWRKPNPGMIVAAGERMALDLPRSWIVGDRASDLAAGSAAKLAGGILVSPGDADIELRPAAALASKHFTVDIKPSLAEAIALLLGQEKLKPAAPPR
jgi:D-glycero-D-manno-heptose 1,7-bisphosphate phosphatase